MSQTDQEKFYDDKNADGTPDGLAFLGADKNRDGRPDIIENYLKGLENKFFLTWLLSAIGVLVVTVLASIAADFIGHALGLH